MFFFSNEELGFSLVPLQVVLLVLSFIAVKIDISDLLTQKCTNNLDAFFKDSSKMNFGRPIGFCGRIKT